MRPPGQERSTTSPFWPPVSPTRGRSWNARASHGATAPYRALACTRCSSKTLLASRSNSTFLRMRSRISPCLLRHLKESEMAIASLSSRPTAIVVGGSLGGLFAANLLHQNGWLVDVYERVPEELASRGAGIFTHPELFDVRAAARIDINKTSGVQVKSRVTLGIDGRVLSERDLPQTLTAWGKMY